MKTNQGIFAVALLSGSLLMIRIGFSAEDQVNQTLQEQTTDGQAKELKRQQDLENIRRQNEIDRLQRDLDAVKQRSPQLSAAENARAGEIQRQLDGLRNDQQMQRLKGEQQLDRIQSERDPLRQQQQIQDLQRRQRLESLQDQVRRNQTERDLNRLQQQPILRPGPSPIFRPGRR